jgi:hypothetical protein
MLRDTVLGLPDHVQALYARKFRKLQDLFGEDLVRIAIGGVALSDVGVAERDILEVVRKQVEEGISAVDIVNLRMLLRADLTQGRGGHWRFEHALARNGFLQLLPDEEPEGAIAGPPSSRPGIARAYWEHFRRTGDQLSQARFACVEDPGAMMLYDSFGDLAQLETLHATVVGAYGFAPSWLQRALGGCFIDLWDDCWRMDLDLLIEDWKVIDEVAILLWSLSLQASGDLKSFREEFLNSIKIYEQTTGIMMNDFDDKGLWKTVFANRLRVSVLAENGQWDQAHQVAMDFLLNVNRHNRLDDEELLLICFLASAASPATADASGRGAEVTGEIEEHNRVSARSVLLAMRELQGEDSHTGLLELSQKYPASIATHLYDVLYMNRYAPETDWAGIGFLCWQARTQQRRLQACQPLSWLASEVQAWS